MASGARHRARLARWVGLELEVWRFFLLGLYLRARVPARATAFTHHVAAGWSAIAGACVMLLVVEGVVVHLWLSQAGHRAAMWIALGLHGYGLVWIVGDALALSVNRTQLLAAPESGEPVLELNVGVRTRGRVPIPAIVDVQVGAWDNAGPDEQMVTVSGPANLRLRFGRPIALGRMLSAPVETRTLLLQIDEPERFQRELDALRSAG